MTPPVNPGTGFADPAFEAQSAFRTILAALSEPGTIHALGEAIKVPDGFGPATAILLLTLADYETPVWLDEARRSGVAGAWLRFHASTPLSAAPEAAAFAVLAAGEDAPKLEAFHPGDDLFPDRAATLVIECEALEGGAAVELSGPGIPGTRGIAPKGLRAGFWDEVIANNALYPLGVDMVLVSGHRIIGLPRSTLVTQSGQGEI